MYCYKIAIRMKNWQANSTTAPAAGSATITCKGNKIYIWLLCTVFRRMYISCQQMPFDWRNEQQANKIGRDGLDTILLTFAFARTSTKKINWTMNCSSIGVFETFNFQSHKFRFATFTTWNFHPKPVSDSKFSTELSQYLYKSLSHLSIMIGYHRVLFPSFECVHVCTVRVFFLVSADESMGFILKRFV